MSYAYCYNDCGKLASNEIFTSPSDDYWSLKHIMNIPHGDISAKNLKQLLHSKNYNVGSLMSKDALLWHLHRLECGAKSYIGCTDDELRAKVKARRLSHEIAGKKGVRGELQDILTSHDNFHRSFHGFLDLPPEVRTRIYGYYFDEFRKPLHCPVQPPIALTGSLVRRETLPIFYSTFTFELNLLAWVFRDFGMGISKIDNRVNLRRDTRTWIDAVGARNLADIRWIRIRIYGSDKQAEHLKTAYIDLTLEFSTSQRRLWLREWQSVHPKARREDTVKELIKLGRTMGARADGWRLTIEDIYALRFAVERTFSSK